MSLSKQVVRVDDVVITIALGCAFKIMGTEVIKKSKIATGFALAMTTFANARNDAFKNTGTVLVFR